MWYAAGLQRLALRAISAIQLTRLTMAFGAVSDVWFVILLTRARPEYIYMPVHNMPLWVALLAGATVAVGLFAYGASLNDVLDARHDLAFSPERPIPAGRIRIGQAMIVTVGALIVAMLGGVVLSIGISSAAGSNPTSIGTVGMTLLAATGILFYNAAGKYIPAVGITTVGLIHAAHMLIPNYELGFTLPIWLVMTHAAVIAALVHVLEDKRPRLQLRTIVAAAMGWILGSAILLYAGIRQSDGLWPNDAPIWGALFPIAAVLAFVLIAWRKSRAVTGRVAAEKLKRYGAMWQALYGAAWLMALNRPAEATAIIVVAIIGFAVMTLIKEITGLSDRPVTYR